MSEKKAKEARAEVKVDAREMLKKEAEEAEKACEQEIKMSLAKHKCSMEPTFMATTQGNAFNMRITYRGFDQQ